MLGDPLGGSKASEASSEGSPIQCVVVVVQLGPIYSLASLECPEFLRVNTY